MTASTTTERRLLDTREAAEYLNVSYSWLKKQTAAKAVPHTKIGKSVRFTPEHLVQIVKAGEQTVVGISRGSARTAL